jgi:CheY-like chemotaxis protein
MILDQAILQDEAVQSMLRELPYDLPVISFVFPGSPRHPRYLPSGVHHYLVKPVGRQALTEAVRALGSGIHNLLVVDDDLAMVRFVTLALKSEEDKAASQNGYRLTTASTGAEALERLREDRPDAILLDLALPDISGWDILATLQQDPSLNQVPVILITAHDWPQHTMTGDEQKALQVLMRRPLSHHELTSVLKYLLETIHPLYPTVSVGPAHPTGLSA